MNTNALNKVSIFRLLVIWLMSLALDTAAVGTEYVSAAVARGHLTMSSTKEFVYGAD